MMIDARPLTAQPSTNLSPESQRREKIRASAQRLLQEFHPDFERLEAYERNESAARQTSRS